MTNTLGQDAPNAQDAQTTGAQDAPQTAGQTPPENVSDLPTWAQRIIKETRAEAKASREAREQLEQTQRAAEAKRLQDLGEWKTLAEQRQVELDALQAVKAKADAADAVLQQVLAAQLEQLPADARDMVNTMHGDANQKLVWLASNQAHLMRPAAPNLDAGARGDSTPKSYKLTPEQMEIVRRTPGMTVEKYVAALRGIEGDN